MNLDLFHDHDAVKLAPEQVCDDVIVLRRCAIPFEDNLLQDINAVIAKSPLQNMVTPGGLPMSVGTTSCGRAGWISDSYGYRYTAQRNYQIWPAMPESFLTLAQQAASDAGFVHFYPDSCLINCYKIGAKMSLHQDKNEKDFSQPIVSVSLGLPAIFLMGGLQRSDKPLRIPLQHGDVVVWGRSARLYFHGVLPVRAGSHPLLGERRINLTFRKAL